MSRKALAEMLIRDLAEGLRVFNTLDGFSIPEEKIQARARNIASGLLGNYEVIAVVPVCWVCGSILKPGEGTREGGLALCADPKCEEIAEAPTVGDLARRLANGGAS